MASPGARLTPIVPRTGGFRINGGNAATTTTTPQPLQPLGDAATPSTARKLFNDDISNSNAAAGASSSAAAAPTPPPVDASAADGKKAEVFDKPVQADIDESRWLDEEDKDKPREPRCTSASSSPLLLWLHGGESCCLLLAALLLCVCVRVCACVCVCVQVG
jgi:hypothetical protein